MPSWSYDPGNDFWYIDDISKWWSEQIVQKAAEFFAADMAIDALIRECGGLPPKESE